jgi:methionyl-tRNA formyltransferase
MPSPHLSVIFAGTPEFAARHLDALLGGPHEVIAVYTQPDRPAGRGKKLQASPVKQRALETRLPVYQPRSLRTAESQSQLDALGADVMVVVAYGLILPQAILDAPRLGCLNVHASLLPRWRGAAPIQRAIEAGDDSSGVTIMQMDAGLDTGAMLASARCDITAETTGASLHDTLAELGTHCLAKVLDDLPGFQSRSRPQDNSGATYASKIRKEEAVLDWHQTATELDRKIRAFNPFPVCWSELAGQRVKIWRAAPFAGTVPTAAAEPGTILTSSREGIVVACGTGQLRLLGLQLPGGKVLEAAQLLNARSERFRVGERFSSPALT